MRVCVRVKRWMERESGGERGLVGCGRGGGRRRRVAGAAPARVRARERGQLALDQRVVRRELGRRAEQRKLQLAEEAVREGHTVMAVGVFVGR